MSQRSSITTCGSQVLGYPPEGGNLQVVANATCAPAGSDPITVWIRSKNIDRIEVTWEVHFDNPPKLPDISIAPYIQNLPTIGVTESSFVVSWGTSSEWNHYESLMCVSWLIEFLLQCFGILNLVQIFVFVSSVITAR